MAVEGPEKLNATLTAPSLAKLFVLAGAAGGLVSAVVYIFFEAGQIGILGVVVAIVGAPVVQAITLLAYLAIGYFPYKYLAKRRKLGFHQLTVIKGQNEGRG